MRVRTIHGFKVQYLAVYRTGKSQYAGDFIYQVEALVDDEREVYTVLGGGVGGSAHTVREAKDCFEATLCRRRERIQREATQQVPTVWVGPLGGAK